MSLFSRRALLILLWALYASTASEPAWACTCFGGLLFDEQVKESTLVLLGRVRAQGTRYLLEPTQSNVSYLDVEVLETYRGKPLKGSVRIWDSHFGTSCGGGLHTLPSGTVAVFSVEENKDPHSLLDLWELTGIRPGAEDYLLGTCSEYWKVFKTERGSTPAHEAPDALRPLLNPRHG